MSIAQDERVRLADELLRLGPDAPTLCTGWTTGDLAAHLVVRENDPIAAPGIMIEPLSGLTSRRMADVRAKQGYDQLVEGFRNGPARFSIFRIPGVDEAANAVEYFIHLEDVRRAQTPPLPPRDLGAEAETFFWQRLTLMGRAMFRKSPVGVTLEREDDHTALLRVKPGQRLVTVAGKPSELLLFAFGRTSAADVTFVGEDEAVAELKAANLSM